MTTSSNPPSLTLLHVAAAYAFEVQYATALDRWIIQGKGRYGVEFFWDSRQDEQDFFDELQSFFNQEGREGAYPY